MTLMTPTDRHTDEFAWGSSNSRAARAHIHDAPRPAHARHTYYVAHLVIALVRVAALSQLPS